MGHDNWQDLGGRCGYVNECANRIVKNQFLAVICNLFVCNYIFQCHCMCAKSIVIHWWPICRMAGLFRMWKGGRGDAPTPNAAVRIPVQQKIRDSLESRLNEWKKLANGLLTSPYTSVPKCYNNIEKYTDGNIDTECLVNADETEDRVMFIVWTTQPLDASRQGNAANDLYVRFIATAQGTGFQPIPGPVVTVSNDTIHETLNVWVRVAAEFCIFITVHKSEYLSRAIYDKDGNIAPQQLKTSSTITVQKIMRGHLKLASLV